eukprot:Filipodium_phascolosomae@DN1577_c0_g1_i2.p1
MQPLRLIRRQLETNKQRSLLCWGGSSKTFEPSRPRPPYHRRYITSSVPSIVNYPTGTMGTPSFRLFFHQRNEVISPWHDIPLRSGESNNPFCYNYVNEITRGTSPKYEINLNDTWNPLAQDSVFQLWSSSPNVGSA